MLRYIWGFLIFCSCGNYSKHVENENRNKVKLALVEEVSLTNQDISNKKEIIVLDKIRLSIPEMLRIMSNQKKAEVYTEKVRPEVAYSNEDVSASFTFNTIGKEIDDDKLLDLLPVMAQQFTTVYPQISWVKKGMTRINEKLFIEYEFISPTTNTKVYSLVYFTNIGGELFISTFNCSIDQRYKWESRAKESMQSIREIMK